MGADTPKQFLELDGVPIAILSVRRIASCPLVTQIIVATRQDGIEKLEARLRQEKFKQPVRVIKGGDSRQESVAAALKLVANETELVLIHDAVRPFVSIEHIARVIEEARRCKAAIVGIPAMDTVKEVKRASLPEDVAKTYARPTRISHTAETPLRARDVRIVKRAAIARAFEDAR